uniref:coiled-coil domain-containing protein 97 n=1 Tax=Myxine glutinosa TaxID=7769 RepID=UPI00359022EF
MFLYPAPNVVPMAEASGTDNVLSLAQEAQDAQESQEANAEPPAKTPSTLWRPLPPLLPAESGECSNSLHTPASLDVFVSTTLTDNHISKESIEPKASSDCSNAQTPLNCNVLPESADLELPMDSCVSDSRFSHGSSLQSTSPDTASPDCLTPTSTDLVTVMLHTVAKSGLTVRSQQRGEPDLTMDEAEATLRDLYKSHPGVFLERYHTVLGNEHAACFIEHPSADSFQVKFYLDVMRKRATQRAHTTVRNRRYAALRALVNEGDYFSERNMRERDPLLFQQYVGRFLSDEQLVAITRSGQDGQPAFLSDVLLDTYQEVEIRQRLKQQQDEENGMMEIEEEDEEEEINVHGTEDSFKKGVLWGEMGMTRRATCHTPSTEELALLHEELVSQMHQRFLDGKDEDFDYSTVDNGSRYDNLDIEAQDEEERYFDKEEPEDVEDMSDRSSSADDEQQLGNSFWN